MVRLLFFAGSTREGAWSKKLAREAQYIASVNGIEAVFVDLIDYPMPMYNGDLEEREGVPEMARALTALMGEYQGIFIASPEYNTSVPPLLKNTLDWVTRVTEEGLSGPKMFRSRVFAIAGSSPGYYGGARCLLHLRQVLAVGMGALVIPQQFTLPKASEAFDEEGHLKEKKKQEALKDVVEALAITARKFAA
jgi:chromate reductase, NAD(P)H dehydrogenase (quinone)